MLPEGLVLDSNEGIHKVFRHIFVFDDLAVFGIKNIVDKLALIIIYDRSRINS